MRNDQADSSGTSLPMGGALDRLMERPRRWRQFLHETRVEMSHVTWPTWDDVVSTTTVVIITVAFFGLFFFATDNVLFRLYEWTIAHVKP